MFDKYATRILSSIARSLDNIEQGRKAGSVISYPYKEKIVIITITAIENRFETEEDEED